MHLVYQCLNSETPVPTLLPQELVPPSKRSSTVSMTSLTSLSLPSNVTSASTDNSFGTVSCYILLVIKGYIIQRENSKK